jgi:hypothetical protein
VLGGYLHKEESGEEAKGNSGVELGGTHVEAMTAKAACGAEVAGGRQRRREVVGGDQATVASPAGGGGR